MANQASMLFNASNGAYIVGLTGTSNTLDGEWAEYLSLIRSVKGEVAGGFAITTGGGPTAAQRSLLKEFPSLQNRPATLITNSTLARGLMTAIMWIVKAKMRAYSPSDLTAALDFIQMPSSDRQRFIDEVRVLGAKISSGNPVDLIAKSSTRAA